MDKIQDILFDVLIIIGLIALIAAAIWYLIVLLNRIFKFSRYIIMYQEYRRNKQIYDIKNKLIISKDGRIAYSCISELDEKIEILNKAVKKCNEIKELRQKYMK